MYNDASGDILENYRYKNSMVEIFTANIGGKWTSAFMIDGRGVDAIRGPAFDSREAAAAAAKAEAENLIDSNVGVHTNAQLDTGAQPTGPSPL
jgi:hypothetical protein